MILKFLGNIDIYEIGEVHYVPDAGAAAQYVAGGHAYQLPEPGGRPLPEPEPEPVELEEVTEAEVGEPEG